jgi:hypothetical protein
MESLWNDKDARKESKLLSFTKMEGEDLRQWYDPTLCQKCRNKYRKRGNVFDEWFKDAGYGERNGYCIRIK